MNERRHIDARYAIAWSFCFSVGVLSTHGWRGLGAFALMLAGACIASRAPARRLFASSVPVLILALFVVGAHASTDPLEGARYAAKAYLLALCAIALVLACPPDSIAAAMERFAAPLRRLRLPVDDFCMMTSIALGAIPDLHIQLARLVAAQASRGAAFDAGPPHARVLAWGRAFVALVVVAFRRAATLADAMEARCFGAGVRSSIRLRRSDPAAVALAVAGGAAMLACGIFL